MEDPALIKIYYENGAYSLKDLCNLVIDGTITEADFFHITRLNFQGIMKSRGWED